MTLRKEPWGETPTFEWNEGNREEIWKHGIRPFEVEECFENERTVIPHRKSGSEPAKYGDRYEVEGVTDGGRLLFIIVQHKGGNKVRVVTAIP